MLLELSSLPQIPGADRVVEPSGPQFGPIVGDVNTAGSVCVALELPGTAQDTKHEVRNRGESLPNSNNKGVLCWWPTILFFKHNELCIKVCHVP